jgi:hypothetical protein
MGAWLLALFVAGVGGMAAGWTVAQLERTGITITLVFVTLWIVASWIAWRMVQYPSSANSRWIERFSALWLLAFYLTLGLLPHWR